MKIAKWGNSLAIRIPVDVAEQAGLKEGDEATLALTPDNVIEIRSSDRRAEVLRLLRENGIKLAAPYRFDRNEIYDS